MKSKRKGRVGEQELARIFREAGYDAYRTWSSGAGREKGDIGGVAIDDITLHIECKRQQRLEIQKWWEQAIADCPSDQVPTVIFRRNHEEWRVLLRLEDFLEFFRK